MDPAALGTTIIGLNAVRARQSDEAPRRVIRSRPPHQRRATFRATVAAALRTLADSLDARSPEHARGG
jgi:hypothetical protein